MPKSIVRFHCGSTNSLSSSTISSAISSPASSYRSLYSISNDSHSSRHITFSRSPISSRISLSSTSNVTTINVSRNTTYRRGSPKQSFESLHSGSIRITHVLPKDNKTKTLLNDLKKVPVLRNLDERELFQVSQAMRKCVYNLNSFVIVQGDIGRGFFIIKKGWAIVTRKNFKTNAKEFQRVLREGDYFGEMALLNNVARGSSVCAKTKLTVYFLDKSKFRSLLTPSKFNSHFAAKRQNILCQSRRSSSDQSKHSRQFDAVNKSTESTAMIRKALKESIFFRDVAISLLEKIVEKMSIKNISIGEVVVEAEKRSNRMYILDKGLLQTSIKGKPDQLIPKGKCFGELALIIDSPITETVRAVQDSVVWSIDRVTYRQTVREVAEKNFKKREDYLAKVPFFSSWQRRNLAELADVLEKESFPAGETVIREGSLGHHLYIIISGKTKVFKDGILVRQDLGDGSYFCEGALKTDNYKNEYTIMCNTNVICLKLGRKAVDTVINVEHTLKKFSKVKIHSSPQLSSSKVEVPPSKKEVSKQFKIPMNLIFFSKTQPVPAGDFHQTSIQSKNTMLEQEMDTSIKFENLKYKAFLGKGSFGKVTLVQDKTNGKTYALKAISIRTIIRARQKSAVQNERSTGRMLNDHPFIVKLYRTFKDSSFLYFLLEPCLGGELFTTLRSRSRLDNNDARFYIASVLLAFEHMHSKHIIYRDLKPENLILDREGYLKITDFGFAKNIGECGRTFTLCGTPGYMAPEVLESVGHGYAVDWWCLGILTYEMLASIPPFSSHDARETYNKIRKVDYKFPPFFTDDAKDFIGKLLVKKPSSRLGVNDPNQAKQHKWFEGFSFEKLIKRQLAPPIVTQLKDEFDVSNFEDYSGDDSDLPVKPFNGCTDWCYNF